MIDSDPIASMNRDVQHIIDKHMNVLIDKIAPHSTIETRPHNKFSTSKLAGTIRHKLKSRNPHIPLLHCATKLHKVPPDKIRPISSNINASCERIAKWLVKQLHKFTAPNSYSVENSIEFVQKIQNVKVRQNEVMVSYDVESLYPSIPVEETLNLLEEWLTANGVLETHVHMYTDLARLCMEQNYFLFRNSVNNDDRILF